MRQFQVPSSQRLDELIDRFAGARIAVLGDYFLDKYLAVDPRLAETSVETGKMAHQVVGVRSSPGAAGTVVGNLAALGAGALHAIGFIGPDGEGYELRQGLTALGCRTEHLLLDESRHTPTYLKPHDATVPGLAGEHSRYDTKNRNATPHAIEQRLVAALDAVLPQVDAVIVADQVEEDDCGVVTAGVRAAIAQRAERWPHVLFWADSRRRIRRFKNCIIKPNQFEAVAHENPRPDEKIDWPEIEAAVGTLRAETGRPMVITLGPRGMLVCESEATLVPGVPVDGPIDTTGAGDSATAGAVLALAAGATLPEAALVGNLVASITIQQLGTTGVARPEQLRPRLELWQARNADRR